MKWDKYCTVTLCEAATVCCIVSGRAGVPGAPVRGGAFVRTPRGRSGCRVLVYSAVINRQSLSRQATVTRNGLSGFSATRVILTAPP